MIDLHVKKELLCKDSKMDLHVDLHVKNGNFIAISGESGAGKSTFLRVLAGLEKSKSKIVVDGNIWQDEKIFLPPQKRKIGFVFQNYALFPNMNVLQNLIFIKNDVKKAQKLLDMCGLGKLKNRHIQTLSGGQKQRVSLCRALMNEPKLLLLDEAFSALDSNMRVKLQDELLNFHNEFKTTTFMVTHDPSEIYKLANLVIVLSDGKVVKQGEPKEVLLKTKGNQKFSLYAKVLDIKKVDIVYVIILSIGQQITEIIIDKEEAKDLKIGDKVSVSTKAFDPIITK